MSIAEYLLVGLAAVGAGLTNALAGGGTLITFPTLIAVGMPPIAANVTNTVALCPGYLGGTLAQANDLRSQERRLWFFVPAGVLGGVIGGILLLNTGERLFRELVPFLILLASGLLAVQDPVGAWLLRRSGQTKTSSELWAVLPVAPSLVMVNFFMPFSVAGVTERNYHVTGLIVDAVRGLVAVDRNTVPVPVGDVRLTFGGSVEVPGKVEYVHPLHNLALVSFDPRMLDGTPLSAANLDQRGLEPGEPVTVVGLGADARVRSIATSVATVEDVAFPLSRTLQFRDSNLEVVNLVNAPDAFDGVVLGRDGRVRALWSGIYRLRGRSRYSACAHADGPSKAGTRP